MNDSPDTPERLMEYAAEGRLTKHALATTLTAEPRRVFLKACAAIEKRYTDECAGAKDPCLESGCALEGEVCLEPLLRAGTHYHKACAAEWIKLYADRENRADSHGLTAGESRHADGSPQRVSVTGEPRSPRSLRKPAVSSRRAPRADVPLGPVHASESHGVIHGDNESGGLQRKGSPRG